MPQIQDPNRDIKRKLITIPLIAISAVAIFMGAGSLLIVRAYAAETIDPGVYMALALLTAGVITLFAMILIPLMRRRFIDRLDRLQSGLFGFLDYLAGKRDKITYIDEKTGDMSDTINAKMREIEKNLAQDRAFMQDLIRLVQAVEQGDYSRRIDNPPATLKLREIHTQINHMLTSLQKDIGRKLAPIIGTLQHYAREDYTSRISPASGEVEIAVNRLGEVISKMLEADRHFGESLSQKAKNVNEKISHALEDIDAKLGSELQTIIESVDDITEHIKSNVESASFIASYTQSVTDSAREGEVLAQKTAGSMSEIGEEVQKITEAIGVIDKITMQTNILSLNAAVEASTAGEAGKGFAVVAQEVRNLAAQTAKASKEIHAVVERAKSKAESGNAISSQMIEGYHHLVSEVSKTMDIIYEITQNSNLQEQQIQKIHQLVSNMLTLTNSCLTELGSAKAISGQNYHHALEIVKTTEEKKFAGTDA